MSKEIKHLKNLLASVLSTKDDDSKGVCVHLPFSLEAEIAEAIKNKDTSSFLVEAYSKIDQQLAGCISAIHESGLDRRDEVAALVRVHGYQTHIGSRHVAILRGSTTLAQVTNLVASDFN